MITTGKVIALAKAALKADVDASAAIEASEAAQAAASSVEEAAEQIATNAEDIAVLKGETSANTKSIATIQSLLNGALSTEQIDSTSAYAKTVPSKAQPYAAVQEVGGRTVVWAQYANLPQTGSTTINDVTITNNGDGSLTLNGTASARWTSYLIAPAAANGGVPYTSGHKYMVLCDATLADTYVYCAYYNGSTWVANRQYAFALNDIVTVENYTDADRLVFTLDIRTGASYSNVTAHFTLFDLTKMFGPGNEPATVAEFQSMFPTINPAYNAGTLISAGVTGAVSDPHNIAIPSLINTTETHFYLDADIIRRHFISPGDCLTIYIYKMSDGTSIGSECALAFWKDSASLANATASSNRHIYFQSGAQGALDVNLASLTPDYNKVSLYIGASAKGIDLGVVIVAGATTITQYIPSRAPDTLPIPTAVQQLPGYGWSAGTAYNYVDWQRKVYVQNVAMATFDGSADEGWYLSSPASSTRQAFLSTGYLQRTKAYLQIINDRGIPVNNSSQDSPDEANIITMRSTNYEATYLYIFVPPSTLSGLDAFKAWLAASPITITYTLATPVETDISQYLTDDNLLSVEPGGTVTFPNQLGDDYRLPVPSDVEYTIGLAPDTPSADGTYTLQCTVTDGVATYEWVSA